MATEILPIPATPHSAMPVSAEAGTAAVRDTEQNIPLELLHGLASLKLTVTLLALSIVLIFVGTLAQVQKDIWQVIHEYFRVWITWVDLQLFFPPSFVGKVIKVPGSFPFPGGADRSRLLPPAPTR